MLIKHIPDRNQHVHSPTQNGGFLYFAEFRCRCLELANYQLSFSGKQIDGGRSNRPPDSFCEETLSNGVSTKYFYKVLLETSGNLPQMVSKRKHTSTRGSAKYLYEATKHIPSSAGLRAKSQRSTRVTYPSEMAKQVMRKKTRQKHHRTLAAVSDVS